MGGMGGGGPRAGGAPPAGTARPAGGAPGAGAMGGSVSTTMLNYLLAHQGSAKYLLAGDGSHVTASIILATGKPVVTIGGFSGNDPAPTVSQLADMVANGQLKYVLVGGAGGGPGGGSSSAITSWVQQHGKAVSGLGSSGGTLYAVTA
jgi:4-amino-4-deoxy-L-arabinose transferase-like glycosyltransferase